MRNDPVLHRIANGSSHAVPSLEFQVLELYMLGSVFLITALYLRVVNDMTNVQNEARECFRAFDEANLRADVPISYGQVGDDNSFWDTILIDLVFFCNYLAPGTMDVLKARNFNTSGLKQTNAVVHFRLIKATHG